MLDTDIFVNVLRAFKNPKRIADYRKATHIETRCRAETQAGNTMSISAMTVAELEYGAQHSGDYAHEIAAVRKFLSPFKILDFDGLSCPVFYGEFRETLDRAGTPIGSMDLLIAAHARSLAATLVTNNLADFRRIPGLTLENWWH